MSKSLYFIGLIVLAVVVGAWYFVAGKQNAAPKNEPQQEARKAPANVSVGSGASQMSFFVTSMNPGKGADLGGIAGADNYCKTLATAAGAGNKTWRAYLSTMPSGDTPAVNARDRIGKGPWQNIKGIIIANNLDELHNGNKISKETALTEKGALVNGRGDTPNLHDILTGSGMDGRAIPGDADTTCGNWVKSGESVAMLGHHDRMGLADDVPSKSWNSSHLSRGCSLEALASSGGGGLFYCFAE